MGPHKVTRAGGGRSSPARRRSQAEQGVRVFARIALNRLILTLQAIKAKMDELRPLIPVLEEYKADAKLVLQFKDEAQNLTTVLNELQEEIGAHDYDDLQSRVSSLEERLRACMQKLGRPAPAGRCGRAAGLSAPAGLRAPGRRERAELPLQRPPCLAH